MWVDLLISAVFYFTGSCNENKDLGSSFSYYENEDRLFGVRSFEGPRFRNTQYLCRSVIGSLSKSGALVDNVQRTCCIVNLITPRHKAQKISDRFTSRKRFETNFM